MADFSPPEIAIAVAAVVSAVGGCAAAAAAFWSARSALDAARSAEDAGHRAALREVSAAASNVVLEVKRLQSHAVELDTEYQAAGIFSGSFQNSNIELLRKQASELAMKASSYSGDAALFTNGAKSLMSAPPVEVDRVLMRMCESLAMTRALRDELDRKFAQVSATNAEERARRLSAKYAK